MKNLIYKIFKTKYVKLIALTSIIIAAIIFISMLVFISIVDPNRYKAIILSNLHSATGANVNIDNIHWKLNPGLHLIIDNISISATPLFNEDLIKINKAECAISITPLLYGKIKINDLFLDNLHLNLIDKGNKNNWTFKVDNDTNTNAFFIELNQLDFKDATLNYTNTVNQQKFSLNKFNLKLTTNIWSEMSFSTDNKIIKLENINYAFNNVIYGKLNLNYDGTNYNANLNTDNFALNDVMISLNQSLNKNLQQKAWQEMSFQISLAGNSSSLKISDSQLNLGKNILKFNLIANSLTPLTATNQINADQIELSDLINLKGHKLKLTNLSMTGNTYQLPKSNTLVSNESLQINKLTFSDFYLHNLALQVSQILSDPLKIISIPITIGKIKASLKQATTPTNQATNNNSNLGYLKANLIWQNELLSFPQATLIGPDLKVNFHGQINTKDNHINSQLMAQFIADPKTLTGKIIYPISLNGNINNPDMLINWDSVSKQLAVNIANSLQKTGKEVNQSAKSTIRKISNKIKSWF